MRGLISNRSIAYGIAKACHREGAELAFTYQNERFKDRMAKYADEFGYRIKLLGITKRVSPHILRHSHATALLEMGRSINEVQARLGHCDVRTTMIYLHCVDAKRMPSPMDCLCEH